MKYGLELPGFPYNFKAKATRAIRWGQRQIFSKLLKSISDLAPAPLDFDLDEANDFVYERIKSGTPFLLSRFGSVEINAVLRGLDIDESGSVFEKMFKLAIGKIGPFWWDNSVKAGIFWAAGVFPPNEDIIMRFSRQVREDCRQIDLLGAWNEGEKRLQKKFFPEAKAADLGNIEPFFAARPWSAALEGKKVLAVHSFPNTIMSQYKRRELLFPGTSILPEFELTAYKSVMSYMGLETPYANWFEAFEKMCDDISQMDFDIAILGCGAYGMSLGAFIKRNLGKQAIHMGGVSQVLFGIKGTRFEEQGEYHKFFNEAWVRPGAEECPQMFRTVDGGAYW